MVKTTDKMFAGKNAYSYLRVSGETQEEGTSLEEQSKENKSCAKRLGLKIEQEFSECGSAMRLGRRREFMTMIDEIKKRSHSYLICYDPTRLSRNGGDSQLIRELIDEQKLTLIFARNNEIFQYPLLPDQSVMLGMKCEFANYEIRVSNQKCRSGIRARSISGFRPCNTPIGYVNDKKNNRAVVVEKGSKLVKQAFILASSGRYTYQQISDNLYAKGFAYPHPSGKVPISTLEHILHNPFYTGFYRVKQTGEMVKGNHKAIISQALFNKVQDMIGGNSPFREKKQFLYSKLIVCDNCGHFLIGDEKRKANGNRYIYYRCMNKACTSKLHIRDEQITDSILTCLKQIRLGLISEAIVETISKEIIAEKKSELCALKHSASHIYSKMSKFSDFVSGKGIDDKQYANETFGKLSNEYSECNTQIAKLSQQIEKYEELRWETMQKRLYDVYLGYDDTTKRKVLELIANKYRYTKNSLKISLRPEIRRIRSRNRLW